MKIEIAGENALILYFGTATDPAISAQVQRACSETERLLGDALIDLVPSYASLLVIYDPYRIDHLEVRRRLQSLSTDSATQAAAEGTLIKLPVWYSTESGPDLEALAERAGMSLDEVIELHASTEYRVYAIGFAPVLPTWARWTNASPHRVWPPRASGYRAVRWPLPTVRRRSIRPPLPAAGT